jgi:hypothetical protein
MIPPLVKLIAAGVAAKFLYDALKGKGDEDMKI